MSRRLSIDFTGKARETIERLADERGVGVSRVVRDAIAREAWYRRLERDGGRLCVLTEDGELHQVEFVG